LFYFFKGDEVWVKPYGENVEKMSGDVSSNFGGLEIPDGVIEGALYNHDSSKYYFFNKGSFWAKEYGSDEKVSDEMPLNSSWGGLYNKAGFDF